MEMNSQKTGNNRKAYIDMIRAFAICLVVMFHFSYYMPFYNATLPGFYNYKNGSWGSVGVFLFFMISGNCLYSKYRTEFKMKEFLLNRFKRIIIPFWICYAFFFLFNFWQSKAFPEVPIYRFLLTIIGMDGFLSYKVQTFYVLGEWYLGCIIIIYLLFPIVRFCMNKNIHVTLAVLFAVGVMLFYNNFFSFFKIDPSWNPLVGVFYFVAGVWIEKMLEKINKWKLPVILAVLLVGLLSLTVDRFVHPRWGEFFVTIAFYVFFMSIEKIMTFNIINKPISWISKNSYLIFLVHHVVIQKVAVHFNGARYSFKGIFCVFVITILWIGVFVACYNRLIDRKIKSYKRA